ncbi:hypothetical protein [Lysinibacillus sp. NPDC093688]|uniref:hypothetical protein n=1 Tax=Lysinibacillus sp. NPDC093688 TaxID=3390577 RepID=UPI003CFD7553
MITVSEEKNTISFSNFNFFQQIFYVPKVQRQVQKSPTSIGGEMNADLSYFSTGVQTPAADASLSLQKTLAEIEELSLRAPCPVATTE